MVGLWRRWEGREGRNEGSVGDWVLCFRACGVVDFCGFFRENLQIRVDSYWRVKSWNVRWTGRERRYVQEREGQEVGEEVGEGQEVGEFGREVGEEVGELMSERVVRSVKS